MNQIQELSFSHETLTMPLQLLNQKPRNHFKIYVLKLIFTKTLHFIFQITSRSSSSTRQNTENSSSIFSVENCIETKSTLSQFSSQSSNTFISTNSMSTVNSLTLDEIVVSPPESMESQSSINRGEVRKSKSKMRTYLKKCKNAIIGQHSQVEDIRPIATHDTTANSCTSWYLDENDDSKESTEQIFGVQSINFEQPVDKGIESDDLKEASFNDSPIIEVTLF